MPPLRFSLPENRPVSTRRRRAALLTTAATTALTLGPALAAQAHVHVHPDSTVAGSDSVLTFRVPSESETAGTTKLTITLPPDHPFLKVTARAMPGWKVTVDDDPLPAPVEINGTTLTSAPHTVTWTAQSGTEIPPEQYENFDLSVGPLPAAGELMFTASQSYTDGSAVSWDEPAVAGAEPEHPAPVFAVTTAPAETEAASAVPEGSAGGDTFTRLLAGAGLLAGLAALGLIVARRSPRPLPVAAETVDVRPVAVNHPST